MRQAIFVVVLAGAAFLGGAMVNGPGIRWVQSRLLDYMGLKDGGEIASIDLPPASSASADPHRPAGAPTVTEPSSRNAGASESASKPSDSKRLDKPLGFKDNPQVDPVAGGLSTNTSRTELQGSPPPLPLPTSVPEPEAPRPAEPRDESKLARRSRPVTGTGSSSATRLGRQSTAGVISGSSSPVPGGGEPPKNAQADHTPHLDPDRSETSGPSPAPLDPSVGPALLASLSPSPQAQPGKSDHTKTDTIPLEVAPMSSPSGSALAPSSTPSGSTPRTFGKAGEAGADWTVLRQKLRTLGVSRYTIEGEPGGRVVFSCLIPLAGRQAVSQRFEAEGDDEFQAAHVAIRRISLWQATRTSPSP